MENICYALCGNSHGTWMKEIIGIYDIYKTAHSLMTDANRNYSDTTIERWVGSASGYLDPSCYIFKEYEISQLKKWLEKELLETTSCQRSCGCHSEEIGIQRWIAGVDIRDYHCQNIYELKKEVIKNFKNRNRRLKEYSARSKN